MDKDSLKEYVSSNMSLREIAGVTGKSYSTVRYWISKYNLKTVPIKDYRCSCGETNPVNFYGNKKTICGKCHNEYTVARYRAIKRECVRHKGGSCQVCGFDKYDAALEFHHLDPVKKDVKFSQLKSWGKERRIAELEKCVLLCANCHRGVHAGFIDLQKDQEYK